MVMKQKLGKFHIIATHFLQIWKMYKFLCSKPYFNPFFFSQEVEEINLEC